MRVGWLGRRSRVLPLDIEPGKRIRSVLVWVSFSLSPMDLLFGSGDGFNGGSISGGDFSASGHQQSFSLAAATAVAASHHQSAHQAHLHHGETSAAASLASSSISGSSGHSSQVDMSGPMLYTEPNRTSAIDDIRSGVLYIFIVTIFLSFFLILPGIRNDKFPTFLCITTSLLVTSFILISLFGTTWHIGEAPQMSAAYKAFSRDRIQGELSVKIGLQSVNITLRAHKYYIMHQIDGPIVLMDSTMIASQDGSMASRRASLLASLMPLSPVPISVKSEDDHSLPEPDQSGSNSAAAAEFIRSQESTSAPTAANGQQPNETLADELLNGRNSDGISVDTELESEEAFSGGTTRLARSSKETIVANKNTSNKRSKRSDNENKKRPKYTIRRINVDINYNERFYWIEPQQMRREYHHALERGLPFPILTVVEYLSQDEAGFNWSRQYRLAGYYTSILLWLSVGLCLLMFSLHCAAPKYGIYTMQLLGCLLLLTNLTYSMLVPRGDKELVIPFEGHSLTFRFGWSFWLVLIGGKSSHLG